MSDTLEIAFEKIEKQEVINLLWHLLSMAEVITEASCSNEGIGIHANHLANKGDLVKLIEAEGDWTAFFKVQGLGLGQARIRSALMRLVRYGENYDIDFSFDAETLDEAYALMKGLHEEAQKIAEEFNVSSFYGGLEPAADKDTQYFSNNDEGPLMQM